MSHESAMHTTGMCTGLQGYLESRKRAVTALGKYAFPGALQGSHMQASSRKDIVS